eukprot:gene33411-41226_t
MRYFIGPDITSNKLFGYSSLLHFHDWAVRAMALRLVVMLEKIRKFIGQLQQNVQKSVVVLVAITVFLGQWVS